MIAAVSAPWPKGAALSRRISKAMDVILHIGAHRCASTTFQRYLRLNVTALKEDGVGVWGPRRTRSGLFHGLVPEPGSLGDQARYRRGVGRIRINLEQCAGHLDTLVVSDENMIGNMRLNLKASALYRGVGARMARFHHAFQGYVSDVLLNIRSPETYWTSTIAHSVMRGRRVPDAQDLKRLCRSDRSWRDVMTDLAAAMPGTRLWVLPFETFGGRPDMQLTALARVRAPRSHLRDRVNVTPCLPQLKQKIAPSQAARLPDGDGPWQPFSNDQIAAFRESYADDVMWLMAGADGLASLMDDPDKKWAGTNPSRTEETRGSPNDDQERRMEGAG